MLGFNMSFILYSTVIVFIIFTIFYVYLPFNPATLAATSINTQMYVCVYDCFLQQIGEC